MKRSILRSRLLLLLIIPTITGCAFFNALYNGWQAFNTGMKTEEEMYRNGSDTADVRQATKANYDRAIKKAEKAISYYPKSDRTHDDAFFLKGRTLYQMGAYAEAVPVFKTLQKDFPESKRIPQSWLYMGMSYAESGDYPAADETYTYIIDNFPELNKNQEIVILKADLAVKMKGKSQAIVFLEEALNNITDPARRMYIYDRLAGLYIDLKMYEKALNLLLEKPPFDKSYKDLYFTASVKQITCYGELEKYEEAEKLLLELIDSRHFVTHNAEMKLELAILYLKEKRIDEARKLLQDLVGTDKTDETVAKSWYELSGIQIDIDGKLQDGQESLEKVVEISSDNDLISKAKRRLDGLKQIKIYSDTLTQGVNDTTPEWFLRFKMGERYWLDVNLPDSALAQFETILSDTGVEDSIYVKTLYSKGWIIQELQGDSAAARPVFEQVISDYPAYEEAKEAQRMIGEPVTIMVRRDSANVRFKDAEDLRLATKGYSKDVYYSYLITALKYPEIEDVAAKSLYAAGWVVNQREGAKEEVDTAAAKIFGRLCKDYPESDQCKAVEIMLENGKVKGFVDSYTKFLEEKGKEGDEDDSTALAIEDSISVIVTDTLPLVIPDFKDWF